MMTLALFVLTANAGIAANDSNSSSSSLGVGPIIGIIAGLSVLCCCAALHAVVYIWMLNKKPVVHAEGEPAGASDAPPRGPHGTHTGPQRHIGLWIHEDELFGHLTRYYAKWKPGFKTDGELRSFARTVWREKARGVTRFSDTLKKTYGESLEDFIAGDDFIALRPAGLPEAAAAATVDAPTPPPPPPPAVWLAHGHDNNGKKSTPYVPLGLPEAAAAAAVDAPTPPPPPPPAVWLAHGHDSNGKKSTPYAPLDQTREVTLDKSHGLGMKIISNHELEGIRISHIVPGAAADATGQIKVGDHIVKINGIGIRDVKHDVAVTIIQEADDVRQNVTFWEPFISHVFLHRPAAVRPALLISAHAHAMPIGACNPMVCPIHVLRSSRSYSRWTTPRCRRCGNFDIILALLTYFGPFLTYKYKSTLFSEYGSRMACDMLY